MTLDVLMTLSESDLVSKYAALSPGDLLEIGTYHGGTTKNICESAPAYRAVWSIDRYMDPLHTITPDRIAYEIDSPNLFLIVGWSENLAELWHRPIGFLLIDGEHEYGTPKKEFDLFNPYLVPEGFLLIHDSAGGEKKFKTIEGREIVQQEEPKLLADHIKCLPGWKYLEEADTLVVFQKKRSYIMDWTIHKGLHRP